MAELAEALDDAMRSRYGWPVPKTPPTSWRGLHAYMHALEKAAGGRAQAAAAAGIGRSTWNHWIAKHRMPSVVSMRRLEGAYSRQVIAPEFDRRMKARKLPTLITITAEIRWSKSPKTQYNATKQRTTKLSELKPEDIARVVDAWKYHGGAAGGSMLERVTAERYKAEVVAFEADRVKVELTPKRKGEK